MAPPKATPPARPSMTSTQLMAFIMPMNQTMLIGISSQTGKSIGSPNGWAMLFTRKPNATGMAAMSS